MKGRAARGAGGPVQVQRGEAGRSKGGPARLGRPGRAAATPQGEKRAVPTPAAGRGGCAAFRGRRDGSGGSPRHGKGLGSRGPAAWSSAALLSRPGRARDPPATAPSERYREGRWEGADRTNAGRGCAARRANQRRAGRTTRQGGEGAARARGALWRRGGSRVSPPLGPQRVARSPAPSRAPPLRAAAAAPSCPRRAPRPAVWEAPGPVGRTAPRSMPGVRSRGGCG